MRKSSLGRRSITVSCNDSVAARPEVKSMLLQPGFSQSKRCLSEDRLSGYKPPHLLQSTSKCRSEISLLENLPPCTPNFFKQQNTALSHGSVRPSRSSSMGSSSNRFSSVGSMKCSKKESRPINDKHFQSQSLKKVQDFFKNQPNCLQILDNSYNVKPMTLKKFINMTDYLLKRIDGRTNLTKENYIEEVLAKVKLLNYGGKLDRSWLVVVNAQHAWCHVIAFLVWLVGIVRLQEIVQEDLNFLLYPDPFCVNKSQNLVEANIMHIQPYVVDQFQAVASNRLSFTDLDSEFERADDLLIEELLKIQRLTDEDIQILVEEEMRVKSTLENPEHEAEEMKLQQQESDFQSVRESYQSLKDFFEKTKKYIETKTEEIEKLTNDNEALKRVIREKTLERDKLHEAAVQLKHKTADVNENNKQRLEYQRVIQINEKSINELLKSMYKVEIASAKLLNEMEAPLIEYNNLIALYTKNEPRLKSCMVNNKYLILKKSDDEKVEEAITEAERTLLLGNIKSEWEEKVAKSISLLDELETTKNTLKQDEVEIKGKLTKIEEDCNLAIKEGEIFMQQKKKDLKELQEKIKHYEEETKKLVETTPVVNTKELDQLKKRCEARVKEIYEVMALSEKYFTNVSKLREDVFNRIKLKKEESLRTIENLITKRGKEGKQKKEETSRLLQ